MTLQEKIDACTAKLQEAKKENELLAAKCAGLEATIAVMENQAHRFCFENVKCDEKVFKFYTGITVEDFFDVLAILGDSVDTMTYHNPDTDDHEGRMPGLGHVRSLCK